VRARPRVVLDVVAVVEKEQVVEPPVVADRPPRVLVAPLQRAQAEAEQEARQIDRQREARVAEQERRPERARRPTVPEKLKFEI